MSSALEFCHHFFSILDLVLLTQKLGLAAMLLLDELVSADLFFLCRNS
jgi:hypothetical protein